MGCSPQSGANHRHTPARRTRRPDDQRDAPTRIADERDAWRCACDKRRRVSGAMIEDIKEWEHP
jgi:hypothetical protein